MKISVSCVAASPKYYELGFRAILNTINNLPTVSKVYWISDKPFNYKISVPVYWIRVKPFIVGSSFDLWYNYITLRILPAVVDSDYDVIVSSDGFAVNRYAWTNEFLATDYIGAVWPWMPKGRNVGNGGFSWRSRKLYDALIDWNPSYHGKDWPNLEDPHYHIQHDGSLEMPEDACLASAYRTYLEKKYGIKYASEELANKWSVESITDKNLLGSSFGFHGPFIYNLLYPKSLDNLS